MFDSISQFPYQIMYLNWIGETKFGAQEKETTKIAEISSGSSGTTIDMGEEERVNFRDSITRNENENISRERKANGSGEGENMENWWGFPLSSLLCSGVGGDVGEKMMMSNSGKLAGIHFFCCCCFCGGGMRDERVKSLSLLWWLWLCDVAGYGIWRTIDWVNESFMFGGGEFIMNVKLKSHEFIDHISPSSRNEWTNECVLFEETQNVV